MKTLIIFATLFLMACGPKKIESEGTTTTVETDPYKRKVELIAEQDGCKLYCVGYEGNVIGTSVYWSICTHENRSTSIAIP